MWWERGKGTRWDPLDPCWSLLQSGRAGLLPVLGSLSTWPFGVMEWHPLLAIFPGLRACYGLFILVTVFIPPTFSSLYPGSPVCHPKGMRNLEHCLRLTGRVPFRFHRVPWSCITLEVTIQGAS